MVISTINVYGNEPDCI